MCPNTSLAALIERETVSRAPPPIAHIKQHTSKYVHAYLTTRLPFKHWALRFFFYFIFLSILFIPVMVKLNFQQPLLNFFSL